MEEQDILQFKELMNTTGWKLLQQQLETRRWQIQDEVMKNFKNRNYELKYTEADLLCAQYIYLDALIDLPKRLIEGNAIRNIDMSKYT